MGFLRDFALSFLRPWKQPRRLHQVIGWTNLTIIAFTLVSFVYEPFWYATLAAIIVSVVLMTIDHIRFTREMADFKREARGNQLAFEIATGETTFEALSAEDQELVRQEQQRAQQ